LLQKNQKTIKRHTSKVSYNFFRFPLHAAKILSEGNSCFLTSIFSGGIPMPSKEEVE